MIPPALLNFIREGSKFLIAGHKEPDGDCVGSQLALASVLRRMGKEAVLCSAGPFKRTEIKIHEHKFISAPDEGDRKGAGGSPSRVIIIDCTGPDRTGSLQPFLEGLPIAAIDHHEAGEYAAQAGSPGGGLFYVDGNAPSASSMILKLISALGLEATREEAEFLFFGLCTDTGFFRHVGSDGAETFEIAAALVRSGANPRAAFADINGGKSLDSRRFLGSILARAESFFDGKLIYSCEEYDEVRRYGLESRDSDSLYQLLQSVAGVEAIAVLRQESPEKCSVGLRSRDWVDVGSIAAVFNGGGHKNAAGFAVNTSIQELKPKIIEAFAHVFNMSLYINSV